MAEVVPGLVTAGFGLVSPRALCCWQFDVNSPVNVRGWLLLAVGELGDAAVALRAPWRVEAVAGQEFVLRLEQLPLLLPLLLLRPFPLPACDLLGVHGLAAARGRVGVVSRPPWTFLCVLLFSPFSTSVLEPDLHTHTQVENWHMR